MENIIYEAILMDVMITFKPKNKKFIDIIGSPYLFLKYNIDSLQLAKSHMNIMRKTLELWVKYIGKC